MNTTHLIVLAHGIARFDVLLRRLDPDAVGPIADDTHYFRRIRSTLEAVDGYHFQVHQPIVTWAAGVEVRALNGKPGLQISPRSVTVHVRGPRAAMQSSAADFEVSIDVQGLKPGQYALPVRVQPPDRVGVVRVDPPEIRVRVR